MQEGGLIAEQVGEVLHLPDGGDPLTFNPFADGVDGLFTLNHKTHGNIVIIEPDMSSAQGSLTVIGSRDNFGAHQGQIFVLDTNDVVAAYFNFGNVTLTDAQFEAYWD